MKRVTTSIKIDPTVWKRVRKHCIDEELQISEYLEALITSDLEDADRFRRELDAEG